MVYSKRKAYLQRARECERQRGLQKLEELKRKLYHAIFQIAPGAWGPRVMLEGVQGEEYGGKRWGCEKEMEGSRGGAVSDGVHWEGIGDSDTEEGNYDMTDDEEKMTPELENALQRWMEKTWQKRCSERRAKHTIHFLFQRGPQPSQS